METEVGPNRYDIVPFPPVHQPRLECEGADANAQVRFEAAPPSSRNCHGLHLPGGADSETGLALLALYRSSHVGIEGPEVDQGERHAAASLRWAEP